MCDFLIMLICIISLLQGSLSRFRVSALFASITVFGGLALNDQVGFRYHFGAAMLDWLFIIISIMISGDLRLTRSLILISITSISVNFAGYIIREYGYAPTLYNTSFILIYSAAVLILIRKDNADVFVRDNAARFRVPIIRSNFSSRNFFGSKIKAK